MQTTNKAAIPNPALQPFAAFTGEWTTSGTHPMLPGTLHGHTSFSWMEGGAFLVMRTHIDHAQVPDGVAIIGSDQTEGTFFMLYFDERGVSRKMDVSIADKVFTWSRPVPGFSQRYTFTLSDDGNTIVSKGELSKDGVSWERDLDLTYTRVK